MTESGLVPDDLLTAASVCRETLAPALDQDWTGPAGDLEWDCRRTLDHIVDTLFLYAAYLASRGTDRLSPPRNSDPTASPAQLLKIIGAAAAVLTEVARAAPPGTRAFHPAGMADVSGWIGMGCEEILLHTDDIGRGLGLTYRPPDDLSARILARLFPWAPADVDPWDGLRWAAGRAALPDRERLGPDWYWHCPPLSEWDGTITKRTAPPAWRQRCSPRRDRAALLGAVRCARCRAATGKRGPVRAKEMQMLISTEMKAAITEQIGHEFAAMLQYVTIATYFESEGLPRLAQHFYRQAEEEREHAMRFVRYVVETGGEVAIPAIPAVRSGFGSAEEAVQLSLDQEQTVTRQINALMDQAIATNDHAARTMLEWFVTEQVEEVSSMETLLRMVQRAGESGLLFVESYLAQGLTVAGESTAE